MSDDFSPVAKRALNDALFERAKRYEQAFGLPALSVIDFLAALLDDGWLITQSEAIDPGSVS